MSTGAIPPIGNAGSDPSDVPPVPPQQPLEYGRAAGGAETDSNAKMFGMLCHLLAFCAITVIPLAHILGPLVMWLLKRHEHPFVDDQGKESLNFQITMTIAAAISWALMFVLIGFILLPIVVIAWIVLVIMASIAASNGQYYRYPINLRLIK